MDFMVLKEKDTWILGTGLFLGFFVGIIINPYIDYKPDLLMKIVLIIAFYFCTILLVAFIKISDRLTVSLKKK